MLSSSYQPKVLLVGHGGREAALAHRFSECCVVYAVMGHENPGIVACVEQSGGRFLVGDTCDGTQIALLAKEHGIDYAFVSADEPLAKGVVDVLLAKRIKAIGGTKAATRIEWDKSYAMDCMARLAPSITPLYRKVRNEATLGAALALFEEEGIKAVVKPQGLSGGKGVKVMGAHLKSYAEAADYARTLLSERKEEQVLFVEKVVGVEFTLMAFSDGCHLLFCPPTYDYPFRLPEDKGPGTGGMGSFTGPKGELPFLSHEDLSVCKQVMQAVIKDLRDQGNPFCGVLNGGFFKTDKGIQFMEFNSRLGDPEGLNIMLLLEGTDLPALLEAMWKKQLENHSLRFSPHASVIKYLVAEEYPYPSPEALSFEVDEKALKAKGITPFYASCKRDWSHDNTYCTLKRSRVLALGAVGDELTTLAGQINEAIEAHVKGPLVYRPDIATAQHIETIIRPPS